LRHRAAFFVRWSVQPALLALAAWARRAQITCDRAALIASRDLDAVIAAVVAAPTADDAGAAAAADGDAAGGDGAGRLERLGELVRGELLPARRIAALRLFADSTLYRKLTGRDPAGGLGSEELDRRTTEVLGA